MRTNMRTLFWILFVVDLQRMPLYVPPIKRDDTKIDSDLSNQSLSGRRRKKKTSVSKLVTREKTMSANKSKSSLKVSAIAELTDKYLPASYLRFPAHFIYQALHEMNFLTLQVHCMPCTYS